MNKDLKKLMKDYGKPKVTYPEVFEKVSNGTVSYDEFYAWITKVTQQHYFAGKIAMCHEHTKFIDPSVRKLYEIE